MVQGKLQHKFEFRGERVTLRKVHMIVRMSREQREKPLAVLALMC